MNLILPAHIHTQAALARAREEFAATVAANMQQVTGTMRELEKHLQRIDPKLRLIYWPHNRPDIPLHQGYFYVWRENEGAPPTFMEIHDGEGNPCLPTSRVLDRIAEANLWDPAVIRDRVIAQRRELARHEAERMRADEERQEHLRDLVNAATRVSIGFGDVGQGWAQNQDGRRRTRGNRDSE